MKNQKGITLVALVITIIIMLILVGVTITVALQGNLFDTAKNAAKDTQNAANEEKNLANGQIIINGNPVNIEEYANINSGSAGSDTTGDQ